MKYIIIAVTIISLVLGLSIPVLADSGSYISTSSSGSQISTGKVDWGPAKSSISTGPIESYLQVESSWYNGGFDIYRTLLVFDTTDIPAGKSLDYVALSFTPTGVIYNEENVSIIVTAGSVEIGSVPFSSLVRNQRVTIQLTGEGIISGGLTSLVLMTSRDYSNYAPEKWNWMTMDGVNNKPSLVVNYSGGSSSTVVPTTTPDSTLNTNTYSDNSKLIAGGLFLLVIVLLVVLGVVSRENS